MQLYNLAAPSLFLFSTEVRFSLFTVFSTWTKKVIIQYSALVVLDSYSKVQISTLPKPLRTLDIQYSLSRAPVILLMAQLTL